MDLDHIRIIQMNYQKIMKGLEQKKPELKNSFQVIAVSKTHSVDAIQALYDLGQRDFGENYAQELVEKIEYFKNKKIMDIRWHFIGSLQSNKLKLIYEELYMLHTLSTESVLKEIDKLSKKIKRTYPLKTLIQVNVDSEVSKTGCEISELEEFILKVKEYPSVSLEGLMCIPDPKKNKNGSSFDTLVGLRKRFFPDLEKAELSMGMSDDYFMALEMGATLLRLGSVLFGQRN